MKNKTTKGGKEGLEGKGLGISQRGSFEKGERRGNWSRERKGEPLL